MEENKGEVLVSYQNLGLVAIEASLTLLAVHHKLTDFLDTVRFVGDRHLSAAHLTQAQPHRGHRSHTPTEVLCGPLLKAGRTTFPDAAKARGGCMLSHATETIGSSGTLVRIFGVLGRVPPRIHCKKIMLRSFLNACCSGRGQSGTYFARS